MTLSEVRELNEGMKVELKLVSGEMCVIAYCEAGLKSVAIPLIDITKWVSGGLKL